jgi:uncharacterized protein (DUF1919 family)
MSVDEYAKKVNQIKSTLSQYDQQTVLNFGLWYLDTQDKSQESIAKSMPFLTFLLIKWSMQIAENGLRKITRDEFLKISNNLYQLQAPATNLDSSGSLELKLRPMLMQQGAPQVHIADDMLSFARQRIWFDQPAVGYYEQVFQRISGISIKTFFSISSYFSLNASTTEVSQIDLGILVVHLTPSETIEDIAAYLKFVGIRNDQLPDFMQRYVEADAPKYEYYAETPLILKPLLLLGNKIVIANRRLYLRSMAYYLSNSLKLEDGRKFKEHFGPTLESYVSSVLTDASVHFHSEAAIKVIYDQERKTGKIVDFIIEDRFRVFMDCKAIEPNDYTSTCTDPDLLAARLKESYTKAIWQGQECCFNLEQLPQFQKKPPFLLVVVHRDHYLSNGKRLDQYLGIGLEKEIKAKYGYVPIPLDHIYYVTVHDFERLISANQTQNGELSTILEDAVKKDAKPETAMFLFSMHLIGKQGVDDKKLHATMLKEFESVHRNILSNARSWSEKIVPYLQARSKLIGLIERNS